MANHVARNAVGCSRKEQALLCDALSLEVGNEAREDGSSMAESCNQMTKDILYCPKRGHTGGHF